MPPSGSINRVTNVEADNNHFKSMIILQGSQLTPQWLTSIKIGKGFLIELKWQVFLDILYDFEEVIKFEDSEIVLRINSLQAV